MCRVSRVAAGMKSRPARNSGVRVRTASLLTGRERLAPAGPARPRLGSVERLSRVLVVDDDPTVSDVVRRYLERAGLAVEVYGDGESALRRALREPPDLVVLDLMLPGMSGLDVCRRLRADQPTPIVMLTALGEESDRVLGLEMG